MLALLTDCTSESMHPRPHFPSLQHRLRFVLLFTTLLFFILRFTIHTTLLSPSLHRTSAPLQFSIVLGVLRTQEIACIWLQDHLRETIFILRLP